MTDYNIIHFKTIDSTAVYALENIERLKHLDVIVADQQTAGHGQFERKWFSPLGNLYLTIIFKELSFEHSQMLQHSATAVIQTLLEYGVNNAVRKLPNDILVNGKKIAGILIKNIFRGQNFRAMMVSCGINLNMSADQFCLIDQPVTSLAEEIKQNISLPDFTKKLLINFKF